MPLKDVLYIHCINLISVHSGLCICSKFMAHVSLSYAITLVTHVTSMEPYNDTCLFVKIPDCSLNFLQVHHTPDPDAELHLHFHSAQLQDSTIPSKPTSFPSCMPSCTLPPCPSLALLWTLYTNVLPTMIGETFTPEHHFRIRQLHCLHVTELFLTAHTARPLSCSLDVSAVPP